MMATHELSLSPADLARMSLSLERYERYLRDRGTEVFALEYGQLLNRFEGFLMSGIDEFSVRLVAEEKRDG